MNMNKIQVIIVSQQVLFRQGIEHSLSRTDDIVISGTAEINIYEILSAIDTLPPDVAIVDIDAPSDSGLRLARKIKQRSPNIGVVMLTSNTDDAQLLHALKIQAAAYLSKETTADELINTIRRVSRGEHPINEFLAFRPRLAEQVLYQFQELSWRRETEGFISPLTSRETEVLDCIARGYLNKEIAVELNISEQTIKNHVTSVLRKLNANARTEAVVIAIKQGLVSIA
jgi:DNA-binding NarL/FixJ family response regulator